MLPQLGFAVLTARDEADAFEIYREHKDKISLILLDLTMPRMNGEEAYRELRRIDPEVRVVPSRGYTENDLSSRFAGKGLVGFIQKYCTINQLKDRLRTALGGGEQARGDEGQ